MKKGDFFLITKKGKQLITEKGKQISLRKKDEFFFSIKVFTVILI